MKGRHFAKGWNLPGAGFGRAPASSRKLGDKRPRLLLRLPRAAKEIALCLLLVAGQAFLFSRKHQVGAWLLLLSVPPGCLLGFLWYVCSGPEKLLHAWLSRRVDRVLAGFGLFFFHLIFSILLFSLAVSYPMGLLIGTFWGSVDLAHEYVIYSVNPAVVLAAGSWLRWWRTAGRRKS